MTIPVEDRPIEALREEVVDRLVMNYAHGMISEEAFERRLNIAMDSQDNREVADQAKDLELEVDQEFVKSKQASLGVKHASVPLEEEESIFNILSRSDRSGRWQVPKQLKLFSLLAGSNLDFSDAEFYCPQVTIDVTCILSNETIYVPENVNVVSRAFALLGSIENSTHSVSNKNAPTIILEGFVLFGSIKIKVKRSIKEKFQAFAKNLKQLLQ